jgi:uncharacterized membrane protein
VAVFVTATAASFLGQFQNTPWFGVVFLPPSFSGQVLFLVAMNSFANYYEARAIFRNALYGFITVLAYALVFFPIIFGSFSHLRDLLESNPITPSAPLPISAIIAFLAFFAIIRIGTFLMVLVEGFFYRRAIYALTENRLTEISGRQAASYLSVEY